MNGTPFLGGKSVCCFLELFTVCTSGSSPWWYAYLVHWALLAKKGTSCVYNGNHFISREKEEKPSQPALFWEIGSAYLSGNLVRVERLKVSWVGLAVFTLPILRYRCFLGEQNISHTYDCDLLRVVQSLDWMQCPSRFPPHRTSFRGFLLTNGCTGNLWL